MFLLWVNYVLGTETCQDVGMDEVVRPWRGVSAQDRRAQRRQQLLAACFDVVGESGVDDTTVDAIVKRAGLSKRYFYESFSGRDDVLVGTFDELMARIRERLSDAVATASSDDERVATMVAALARALTEDPRGARLFVEAGRVGNLERRLHQAFDEFSKLLVETLFDSSTDPRVAATALLVVAGTTEVLARWLQGQIELDESDVVELITRTGVRLRDGST